MKANFTPLFLTAAFLILTYPGLADDLYVGPGQTYTTIQDVIGGTADGGGDDREAFVVPCGRMQCCEM